MEIPFTTLPIKAGTKDLWRQIVGTDGKPSGNPQRVTTAADIMHIAFSADGKATVLFQGRWVANVWRILIPEPGTLQHGKMRSR
jgi:hypothetical protein